MHGAVNIQTKRWGYVCFKLPTYVFGRWWPAYFYLSPNATPWASTLLVGKEYSKAEKVLARIRKTLWGHGYSTEEFDPQRPSCYRHALDSVMAWELNEGNETLTDEPSDCRSSE